VELQVLQLVLEQLHQMLVALAEKMEPVVQHSTGAVVAVEVLSQLEQQR
jgi:surfactin synthase thioesterase subunit